MTQITINIEDSSMVPHLKKILSAIKGVSIDDEKPKNGLDEAFEDVKHGRVSHYSSADEMFKSLGI